MRVPIRKKENYRQPKPDPYITAAKYQELKKRLIWYKNIKRPRLSQEVQHLASMGDFSENAGYQLAKSRLRNLNNRILAIEEQLKHAQIINPSNKDKVEIGSLVTITINKNTKTYRLLGSSETNPSAGIISYSSPLGQALLNHQVGDKIELERQNKKIIYQIIKID